MIPSRHMTFVSIPFQRLGELLHVDEAFEVVDVERDAIRQTLNIYFRAPEGLLFEVRPGESIPRERLKNVMRCFDAD